MQLDDLAKLLKAEVVIPPGCQPPAVEFTAVAALDSAQPSDVSFLTNPSYAELLHTTQAGAVIVKNSDPTCKVAQLIHPHPYVAFARASQHFFQPSVGFSGVSSAAHIAESAKLGTGVRIAPQVSVGQNVTLGDGVVLFPGVVIGDHVTVGARTVIRANASIEYGSKIGEDCLIHAGAVLGADGFGFAPEPPSAQSAGDIVKIPQVGIVVLEDAVEIGAGSTVDRAAMGETRIGSHTKLDSQVHVAHNVTIGHHTMIAGQVAIAGSAKIGNWVVIGGKCAVNGHIKIDDGVIVGGAARVTKSLKRNKEPYMGFPAAPASDWRRQIVALRRLPSFFKAAKQNWKE